MTYPLFLSHPKAREEDYTLSHVSKGEDYQARFETLPGRALMWELEKHLFARIARCYGGATRCLDFACGTGRLVGHLSHVLPGAEACGLDVSESMLATARRTIQGATFVCADFREGDWSRFGKFDVITAFRFFPNAQQSLRDDAMRFLSHVLADDGVLVLNNHRNFWSIPFVSYRVAGARQGAYGMTHRQVRELALRNGLEVVENYSYGVVPQTEKRAVLPWRVTGAIERTNQRWTARSHRLGYNVIYVLRRVGT
jgi:trans-aconitate methyltransferase